MGQDNFSVVIRSRNEEAWIGHAIQSVLDHLERPEIIIIDNNSSDKTLEIVRRFQHDPKLDQDESSNYTDIVIKTIDQYTPGKALNIGIKSAKNKYILVLSSHCVITHLDKESIIKNLNNYNAIFGNQVPIWEGKRILKRYIWSHFSKKEEVNMYSEMEDRYFFHNAFSFFNKDFIASNPFDEYLSSKEDRYWAKDIISKGYKILYDPFSSVNHHYTPSGNTWKSK